MDKRSDARLIIGSGDHEDQPQWLVLDGPLQTMVTFWSTRSSQKDNVASGAGGFTGSTLIPYVEPDPEGEHSEVKGGTKQKSVIQ